jgi:peptidoglycan/xylan/chitin deacetylase (PgdA/CDA1 family)
VILFLTYHRIQADGAPLPKREFYAVTRTALAGHLRRLAAAGLRPADVATISAGVATGTRQCYLSFDDGTADHYELVLPLLREMNLRAVFFVPTAKLDRPDHLTRAQLRELAQAGQTIGCHSHEHKRMDILSAAEVRRQLDTAKKILEAETGAAPWIFAPPGGYANPTVRAAALEAGFRVIRTMRWGFNRKPDLTNLEAVPLHRYMTDRQFHRILAGRQSGLIYRGKELVKPLVPIRAYERFRALMIRTIRTH